MLPATVRRYGFGILILLVICSFSFAYGRKEDGPFCSFQSFRPAGFSISNTLPGKEHPGSTLDDRPVLDKELNSRSVEEALRNIKHTLKRKEVLNCSLMQRVGES